MEIDLLEVVAEVTAQFERSLVRELNIAELSRAFQVAVAGLLSEIQRVDEELAGRLEETLRRLSDKQAETPA